MIEFDRSELERLVVQLSNASRTVEDGLLPIVKRAAHNVKTGMAADAQGHPRFRHLPAAMTYDILPVGLRTLAARIGPDKRRKQGALGNIFYFGTATTPPVEDITAALVRETPNVERELAQLAARAL